MRKIAALLSLVLLVSVSSLAQEKEINTKLSNIEWLGKKVTGEHSGKILFKSGSLKYEGKSLMGGSFVVDMASMTCDDITDADYNAKLIGHLKSDDFFGVNMHPLSQLIITKVNKAKGGYDVTADLTIKGKTHPVSFMAKEEGNKLRGLIMVDRTLYDVRYGSGKFFDNLGDKTIYDEFELTFNVVLN